MYDLVDRPVGQLCVGSRFVLRAMRAWADALGRKSCPPGELATPFLRHGAIDALPSFHRLMVALNRSARDTLTLCPLGCAGVGDSEAVLLRSWADVGGAPARVRETFRLLLADEAAEEAFGALVLARSRLDAAGLAPRGLADAHGLTHMP